jgi:Phytanoyl-CoA dioxygenase (PhyH)
MRPISVDDLAVDYTPSDSDALAVADAQAQPLLGALGCFLARGLFGDEQLEPIRRDLRRLIRLRWQLAGLGPGLPSESEPRFDDGLLALTRRRQAEVAVLQEALCLLLSARQVVGHPRLERLSRGLMGTQTVGHNEFTDKARGQLSDGDHHLLLWHQDYPYVQDSEDGLVYWIPLHRCGERKGSLRLALGSHRLGVLPVRRPDSGADGPAPPYEIAEPTVVDRFPQLRVPVQAGDVLVFSPLLVHANDPNCSGRVRWALEVRHGNLEHPRAVARGWPVG